MTQQSITIVFAALTGLAACRPQPVEDRREAVEAMCADYCPRRVDCVADGFANGDQEFCEFKCLRDARVLEASPCGEAQFALLSCLVEVACEDLPATVAGAVGAVDSPCQEELLLQQEECDFTPRF